MQAARSCGTLESGEFEQPRPWEAIPGASAVFGTNRDEEEESAQTVSNYPLDGPD
jgi:hypothetical protein